jgi:gamma-glutamyltranspeptidase/glutathione hydrolase
MHPFAGEKIMPTQFSAHRPVVMGIEWMITADHPLAARAGAAILEAGGNAVDAAIGANLVMTAVRPHMCGLGGDLFALIYMAAESKFEALNASGRAPSAATLDVFRAKGYTVMPETGLLTATVPGAIAGWQAALEKYGSMSLDRLLPKAIDYAQNGFPLQPRLAESLKILADRGPDAFYRGPLGEALIALCESDGGLIGPQDLAGHTVTWHAPLKTTYRGYEICTQPPNSQGIALLMQANMLENFDSCGKDEIRAGRAGSSNGRDQETRICRSG